MRGRVLRFTLAIAVAAASAAPTGAIARWDAPTSPVTVTAVSAAPVAYSAEGPTDTGRVIVKFKEAPSASTKRELEMDDARKLSGSTLLTEAPPEGVTTEEYAEELEDSPLVEYAEPDYLLRPTVSYSDWPNDPDFTSGESIGFTVDGQSLTMAHGRSWGVRGNNSARFNEVWPALANAEPAPGGVRVAVIDTGFFMNHPARNSNIFAAKDECATYNAQTGAMTTDFDVTPVYANATDDETVLGVSHGTMTASEIGEWTNNTVGSVGAAWDTQVAIYKVMGVVSTPGNGLSTGEAVIPSSALANAITDAVADARAADHANLVINISLELIGGDSLESQRIQSAIDSAHAYGAVIVAAAGNGDKYGRALPTVSYPASGNHVIAVGAYQLNFSTPSRTTFSNYGTDLDIMAPGQLIWGPTKPLAVIDPDIDDVPGYTWWSGTSMASPYVAAAAALLWRVEPTLTPAEIESYLKSTAVDKSTSGWDSKYGWGLLDAYAAYYKMAAPVTTPTAPIKARYETSATIEFQVQDRDTTETTTWHYWDDHSNLPLDGPIATKDDLGSHTLTYWSVDSNGVAEKPHTVSVEILPADDTAPETSADTSATYAGRAPISLEATDNGGWGVAQTYYRIDNGATKTGTSVSVGSPGSHVLQYWSTDQAGNVEETRSAIFSVTQMSAAATITRSAGTINRGAKIKLSGTLKPGRTGDFVRIWYKSPGSSTWRTFTTSTKYYRRTVTSVNSSGVGTWSPLTYPLGKSGRYYFRVVFSGDSTNLSRTSATSNTVSVRVR